MPVLYQDCPLQRIQPIARASYQLEEKTVMICPRGRARGRISIPLSLRGWPITVLTRSRWARIGLDTEIIGAAGHRRVGVTLYNWSHDYGLVLRAGDRVCTLARMDVIRTLPLADAVDLTADCISVKVRARSLPKIPISDHQPPASWLPFINLSAMDAFPHTEDAPYDALDLEPRDMWITRSRERVWIERGCIGYLEAAMPGLVHGSSRLVYAGSSGALVLEFRALYRMLVYPGAHVATLMVYRLPCEDDWAAAA